MLRDIPKRCGNCGHGMEYVKTEHMQLGKYSGIFGNWPNWIAGALNVEIWSCPDCGKLDFYWSGPPEGEREDWEDGDHIAQTTCPACGHVHDLDDPKCPLCGAKNPNI